MSEFVVARRTYVLVWIGLMLLMLAQAWLSRLNLGEWSTLTVLCIATMKALLVVLFFMHVRYENQKIAWVVVIAGFFWLAIMLSLTLTDYMSRGYLGVAGH